MEILYNPRCSECREAGRIPDERGVRWERTDYLEGKLTREKIEEILGKLGSRVADVVRWDESILKEKGISRGWLHLLFRQRRGGSFDPPPLFPAAP